MMLKAKKFLSTPSARRATHPRCSHGGWSAISIHALREEGDQAPLRTSAHTEISIHALREEGDLLVLVGIKHVDKFLSTPSARRATFLSSNCRVWQRISIHALREEGDRAVRSSVESSFPFLSTPSARRATLAFSIHPTHGIQFLSTPSARRATRGSNDTVHGGVFLSTPSARRATLPASTVAVTLLISIHALREEGDTSSEKQS